jgi:hypothetical protein
MMEQDDSSGIQKRPAKRLRITEDERKTPANPKDGGSASGDDELDNEMGTETLNDTKEAARGSDLYLDTVCPRVSISIRSAK